MLNGYDILYFKFNRLISEYVCIYFTKFFICYQQQFLKLHLPDQFFFLLVFCCIFFFLQDYSKALHCLTSYYTYIIFGCSKTDNIFVSSRNSEIRSATWTGCRNGSESYHMTQHNQDQEFTVILVSIRSLMTDCIAQWTVQRRVSIVKSL